MHFAERYKRKIRELEADRERLENRLIEEHAENILLREDVCRLLKKTRRKKAGHKRDIPGMAERNSIRKKAKLK